MRNSLSLLNSRAPLLLPEFIRVDNNVHSLRVDERQPLARQTPAVDGQVVRVSDGSAVEPLDAPPAARHTPHAHCVRLRLRVPLAAEEEAAVTPHESGAAGRCGAAVAARVARRPAPPECALHQVHLLREEKSGAVALAAREAELREAEWNGRLSARRPRRRHCEHVERRRPAHSAQHAVRVHCAETRDRALVESGGRAVECEALRRSPHAVAVAGRSSATTSE